MAIKILIWVRPQKAITDRRSRLRESLTRDTKRTHLKDRSLRGELLLP